MVLWYIVVVWLAFAWCSVLFMLFVTLLAVCFGLLMFVVCIVYCLCLLILIVLY